MPTEDTMIDMLPAPTVREADAPVTPPGPSPVVVSDTTYVAIPSHDTRAVIHSLIELALAAQMVGGMQVMTAEAGNIPKGRNQVLRQIQADADPATHAWVLWLDSDILITPGSAPALAQYIEDARDSGRQWIANYNMANGQSVLMKDRILHNAAHYTTDELLCLPDGSELGMGGFGLSFLFTDLSYQFWADEAGEDIHYWLDRPEEKVYYAKHVLLKHRKAGWQ